MTKEIWKDIEEFEGKYSVSNKGRVKSVYYINKHGTKTTNNNKLLRIHLRAGYNFVLLQNKGVKRSKKVSRLVAEAFIPNPKNKPMVNHKDCNKLNDYANNLEWVTSRENIIHAIKNGSFGRACLKIDAIADIRTNCCGLSEYSKYAKKYNVSKCTISDICNNRTWNFVEVKYANKR